MDKNQLKEEVNNLEDPKLVLESYLKDPKVSNHLLQWTKVLSNIFKSKWFTIQELMKQTAISKLEEAQKLVILLNMKGNLYTRQYGNRQEVKYKLCISVADKVSLLQDEIKSLEEKRNFLLQEIQRLEELA